MLWLAVTGPRGRHVLVCAGASRRSRTQPGGGNMRRIVLAVGVGVVVAGAGAGIGVASAATGPAPSVGAVPVSDTTPVPSAGAGGDTTGIPPATVAQRHANEAK